jgi:antitoxin MazE
MRAKVVKIGNSRGLRLPKAIRDAVGIKDSVNLVVEDGRLVLTPTGRRYRPRAGWAEAIDKENARGGPPELLW